VVNSDMIIGQKHRRQFYQRSDNATMQFTPQQLAGGACYSDSTRVGNWVEDVCLRDYQKAHFEVIFDLNFESVVYK
jgi:hypothetical protein